MGTSYATKRKNHAEHNEEVYTHLKDNTEFTDWLITTAFYTAVHYVESYLFPYKDYDDSILETIHDYHRDNNYHSLHESRDQLVKYRMGDIHGAYKELQDLSQKARYREYEFSTHKSHVVLTEYRLEQIKEFISSNED